MSFSESSSPKAEFHHDPGGHEIGQDISKRAKTFGHVD